MACIGFLIFFQCSLGETAQSSLSFCDGARPITWSRADTRATKEQIDTHNRKFKRFCLEGRN
jgi:hypothetical protein